MSDKMNDRYKIAGNQNLPVVDGKKVSREEQFVVCTNMDSLNPFTPLLEGRIYYEVKRVGEHQNA